MQLWLDARDFASVHPEFRVIPKDEFILEMLSPVPKEINRRYFKNKSFFAGDEYSWLDRKNGGKSVIMAEIGLPTITWHPRLVDTLMHLAHNIEDDRAAPINEFLNFIPSISPTPTPHFFGICAPVQYDPVDMPSCLLALDSQGPYIWGDCGNAQIFYSFEADGSISFAFDWSCH
ncbi:hypothetical protein [Erythrobacter cryptus]|uniref:hypothetical protein n=1 Tax=Erythrobacter cryptus TaxID=196588 RepID=UPI0012EC7E93|nr:hypothetical protein [Erythrobacter cryptus]